MLDNAFPALGFDEYFRSLYGLAVGDEAGRKVAGIVIKGGMCLAVWGYFFPAGFSSRRGKSGSGLPMA